MTFIDLFAGIGGFRKGMELAGHKCLGFCEFDKFAYMSYVSMHCITDEQRNYLNTLSMKDRQKEIMKKEYLNNEWYEKDICNVTASTVPNADCWCFGAPCQDFSIAGKRKGLAGDRSSLIREVFRVLREMSEEHRPEWLIYENVKGMLSSNNGFDFLAILIEMAEFGYDISWELFNTANFGIPQNRERVYTVGHLRRCGTRKLFPLKREINTDSTTQQLNTSNDNICIPVITPDRVEKRQHGRRFKDNGDVSFTLTAQDRHGVALGVLRPVRSEYGKQIRKDYEKGLIKESRHNMREYDIQTKGITNTIDTVPKDNLLAINTSDYIENNDTNGLYVKLNDNTTVYAVWYEKYNCYIAVRRLTPKECFRLQGWSDDYYEKAAFVTSESQLYKQAGNGVTVDVVYEIAKQMGGE